MGGGLPACQFLVSSIQTFQDYYTAAGGTDHGTFGVAASPLGRANYELAFGLLTPDPWEVVTFTVGTSPVMAVHLLNLDAADWFAMIAGLDGDEVARLLENGVVAGPGSVPTFLAPLVDADRLALLQDGLIGCDASFTSAGDVYTFASNALLTVADKGVVLTGFSAAEWASSTSGLSVLEYNRLLDKGIVKTGSPELAFLFAAPFDSSLALDILLDKGIASCEAGEPQDALATLASILVGMTFDTDPPVFDDDGVCTSNCNGTWLQGLSRLLDKGVIFDGFDPADFLASLTQQFDLIEDVDRVLDKGVAACGLDNMTDVFDFATNIRASGEVATYSEVLDRLLDKGAFHGRQRSVFSEAFPWMAAGVQSGSETNDRLLDKGVIVTGDTQPALRWLLGLGFATGPLAAWQAEWEVVFDKGLVLVFEGSNLWLRSVENYFLP